MRKKKEEIKRVDFEDEEEEEIPAEDETSARWRHVLALPRRLQLGAAASKEKFFGLRKVENFLLAGASQFPVGSKSRALPRCLWLCWSGSLKQEFCPGQREPFSCCSMGHLLGF